jgi:glutathione synthase
MKTPKKNPVWLWVTDPWDTLALKQDTTIRLMEEAVRMGIQTFWTSSDRVFQGDKNLTVSPFFLLTVDAPKNWRTAPATDFDQIHDRIDPPVNQDYFKVIDELMKRGATADQIINPPAILKNQSEKLPPTELHHLCPKGWVIRQMIEAETIFSKIQTSTQWVCKPLNQAQSKGVVMIQRTDSLSQWIQNLSAASENFQEPVLVQEYLTGIDQGEVRLWFAEGEFIAALKKFPKKGDFRVLIDEGSRIQSYILNSSEQNIASEIGSVLKKQKVGLAAIDLIDEKISDYNITSPGLLIQLEQVHGQKNFAEAIILQLLKRQ